MKKTSKKGIESSQKSIWINPDLLRNNENHAYFDLSGTWMLIDDVSSSIIPYSDDFNVNLTPPLPVEQKDIVVMALDKQRSHRGLKDPTREFARQCVQVMMVFGFACYELVYLTIQGEGIKSFRLEYIPPPSLIIRGNKFRQYLPKETAEEENLPSRYVDLVSDNILIFRLPDYLRKQHSQMMESLAFIGEHIFPDFYLENLKGTSRIPYSRESSENNTLLRKIALAKTSRDIGWNARNYDSRDRFEYYVWYRQLLFNKFIIILRRSIIENLNLGLNKAGAKIGFLTQLNIEGLPDERVVEVALEKLKNGKAKNFSEVLNPFR